MNEMTKQTYIFLNNGLNIQNNINLAKGGRGPQSLHLEELTTKQKKKKRRVYRKYKGHRKKSS